MRHTAACRGAMYKNTSALTSTGSLMDTAMAIAQKVWNKSERAMKVQSSDIHFAEDMRVTFRQERFFKEQG